ncbi:MAG TPA: sensor histidine kinase [Bacteroidetes bacterium]|nr:sensor histidine kinase [Bacteroidota bacterium]
MKEMQKEIQTTAIDTENKERKRFSADLHDGLGPLLSSIKLFVSSLESASEDEKSDMIKYIKELLDDSIKSVRTISNNILPAKLAKKGLIEAIKSFSDKLSMSKEINITIDPEIDTNKRFDSGTEAILFRVIQELINNTIKHAEAKNIKISFTIADDRLNIHYTDDGKGFDVEDTLASNKGLGLKNIINRIETLGGKVNIVSNKKQGTIVDIWVET